MSKEKHEMSADLKLVESSLSASEIRINQINSKVVSAEKVLEDKGSLAIDKDAAIKDLKLGIEELQKVLDVV